MRNVFRTMCVISALAAVGSLEAQTLTETETTGKYSVQTNRFGCNWFISAGGGI